MLATSSVLNALIKNLTLYYWLSRMIKRPAVQRLTGRHQSTCRGQQMFDRRNFDVSLVKFVDLHGCQSLVRLQLEVCFSGLGTIIALSLVMDV